MAGSTTPASPRLVRFGPFEADLRTGELRKNGNKLKLSGQPVEILALLLNRPGGVITREEICAKLWLENTFVDFDHSLNAAINKLREALGDSAEKPRYIETLPRRGYRFVGSIEGCAEPQMLSATTVPTNSSPYAQSSSVNAEARRATVPRPMRKSILAIAVSLALVVVVVAAWMWANRAPTIAPQSQWIALTDFSDSVVQPTISSDGRMLAFIRGPEVFSTTGQIYVKLLPDGDPVQLTHDRMRKMAPVFTPDGSKIAYTGVDEKLNWNIYVVPVLGGEPQLLLPNAEGLSWIGEKRVLFSEIKQGVHMVLVTATESRAGQREVYVPPTERGMAHHSALSPDGAEVLMTEMGSAGEWLPCRVVPFDGHSAGMQVGPAIGRCLGVAWSPNGKWMYLNVDTGNGFHLWRQRTQSSNPEQITFGPTEQHAVAVAPDGRALFTAVGTARASIWLHRPSDEDRETSMQGNAVDPRFSPDGTKLYYLRVVSTAPMHVNPGSAGGPPSGNLMAVDLNSFAVDNVFPDLVISAYNISPNGKHVVFSTRASDGSLQLWTALLDRRSAPLPVPAPVPLDQACFASDEEIYLRALENGKHYLERARLDGSGRHKVLTDPIVSLHAVHPDPNWVVVSEPVAGDRSTLRIAAHAVDSSRSIVLCDYCYVQWSPDGKMMYLNFAPGTGRVGKEVAVPTLSGHPVPALPPKGVTLDEAVKLPGAKRFETEVRPSALPGVFAYQKQMVQRNIYRIPLR